MAARGVRRAAALGRRAARRCSAICLGAQTLAHALGAPVEPDRPTTARRASTRPTLTEAGVDDPVLGVLPPRFEALNANGYEFDVPGGRRRARDGPVRAGVPRRRQRVGGAVPPGGAPRPGARRGSRRTSHGLPRPLAELERELDEKLAGVAGARAPALPRVPRCGAPKRCRRPVDCAQQLDRQVVVARPLVPRADVVARVVAERAQELRRDRRARAAVAVRDDLGARLETELGRDRSSASSSISR